jgi:CRISPR-associated protein Csb2
LEILQRVASGLVALGWGIDLAAGMLTARTDNEVEALPGDRWLPGEGDVRLRVPVPGTLDDLVARQQAFAGRFDGKEYTAPPQVSVFRVVGYRCASDAPGRPFAAFSLLRPEADGFRVFDPARRGLTVAGMVRHATRLAAERSGWSKNDVARRVLGHGEPPAEGPHVPVEGARFAFLPLPSIEFRGAGAGRRVGAVRRVLVSVPAAGADLGVAWARRALSGADLIQEGSEQTVAMMAAIPSDDSVVRQYVQPASTWVTVTPMVLPGFDDPGKLRRRLRSGVDSDEQRRLLQHLADRTEGLFRKAILQAGYSSELAENAELEWRHTGFIAGVGLAGNYGVPDHLRRYPRLHVRLTWRSRTGDPIRVPGPVCLGGGRFHGVGLFVGALHEVD